MVSEVPEGANPREYWEEHYGDVDPYENDTKPSPSEATDENYHYDSNGNEYNEFAGSQTPTPGRCNAKLTYWEERYGEPRYCQQIPRRFRFPDGGDYCRVHDGRKNLDVRAQELFETGAFCRSLENFFERVSPLERVLIWALYEDLLNKSVREFQCEYTEERFDFSADPETWEDDYGIPKNLPLAIESRIDDDGVLTIEVPSATAEHDPAMALWNAAVDGVLMTRMKAKITAKGGESKTTKHAQLTAAPNEFDKSPQHFETIEEWTEHHLNLPYSRIVRDRKELLDYGLGEVEEDSGPDAVFEYYNDPLATEPVVIEET